MSAYWDWGDTVSLQRELALVDTASSDSGYGSRGASDEVRPKESAQIVGEPCTLAEAQAELTKARAKSTPQSYTLVGGETVTGFITAYNRERIKGTSYYKVSLTLETSTATPASSIEWEWGDSESLTRDLGVFDEMSTDTITYGDRVFYDNLRPKETVQLVAEPLTASDVATIRTAARARGSTYTATLVGGEGSVTGYITRFQRERVKGTSNHKVTLELMRTDV